jgi:CBS domain-containing membrane protein
MPLTKPVSAIMTITPVVANVSTEFSKVIRLFTEFPVHHLPIVDEENRLIGIVSSNDLPKVFLDLCNRTEKVTMDFAAIDKAISLSDIMTSNPITITSSETIGNAAKIFADKKFLALPVVDNGVLIGILSVKDVLAYIA